MRTRFLNTDYFTPIKTLSFLNLPIPSLPLPRLSDFEERLFGFYNHPDISFEIERLPIDAAFSKFISEVMPQKVHVGYGDFEDPQSHYATGSSNEQRRFRPTTAEIRHSEEDNEITVDEKHIHRSEVIQFEAPELADFVDKACFSEEGIQILSEVSEIENDTDLLKPGVDMLYYDKVQESIYSIEDVTFEYDLDERACVFEDDDSGQEQMNFHHNSFPVLEVDEISLRMCTNSFMEDEILSFLENVKSPYAKNDNLLIDEMGLLGSMQYDVLEFLSDLCPLEQCLESELASMDTFPGMDIISVVEKADSAACLLPMTLFVFQEFEFLEVDSSQIYDVFFKMQTTDEQESCDWMFKEEKNFKNFNELIVSRELALVDETFKSMPIPIHSDHDKIRSLYAIVEKILAELKPQSLSAADGIYLDWNLLEEDKCNSKIFSFCQTVLEELYPHSIDFHWESFDKGVIDFLLSDDGLNGRKREEHEASLNVFSEGVLNGQPMGVASSKLLDDRCAQSGNEEHLEKENAGEATLLFKSMSQFNDLDFFLNPGKAISGEKSESEIKEPITNVSLPKAGESHSSFSVGKKMDDQKLEEVLNFLPNENNVNTRTSEAADNVEACCMPLAVPHVPCTMITEQTQECMMFFPENIIVVNTQNLEKEMIISRRSTYQKILAMEKEGLQVVERDLDLPVDIVIISAICLVWYDCRNIRKKATAADEAFSCLPLCIENIATNVLTLLSFTFGCCILIFEGDINYLSTVMESSDGLYAAAASLGIDLQLFCSYSSDLTDEIILSNISYAGKLCGSIYPKMPESETLAESFLTKFPSINPLTAHAILSSENMFIEFLEASNKHRILVVKQYLVPEESISLFSALCSYGEKEDSKSIMTDCSSSVSSGPDSNKGHFIAVSETKPSKCICSPHKINIHMDGIWLSESLNQFPDDVQVASGVLQRDGYGMLRDTEILDNLQWSGPSFKDLFGQKPDFDIAQMDFSSITEPYDFQKSKDPFILDEIKNPRIYLNDEVLIQNEKSEMAIDNTIMSENVHKDIFGEVVNLTGSLGKDFITSTMDFTTWPPDTEQGSTRKSKAARRLSFGKIGHRNFPTAAAVKFESDLCSSVKDHRKSLQQNDSNRGSAIPLKHPKQLLDNVLTHGSLENIKVVPFKEEISHYGGTPLTKAIQSADPQPGSPWTIEFLNRIREKSRLRQQSLPCDASTPDLGYSSSISKVTKRRSPSILEFFKYKGGGNPGKIHEQKKQKQSKQLSSSSKSERISTTIPPTWTPIDKRSRQTLSFAMNDSGSQTRLVWSDRSAHPLSKKLRNQ